MLIGGVDVDQPCASHLRPRDDVLSTKNATLPNCNADLEGLEPELKD